MIRTQALINNFCVAWLSLLPFAPIQLGLKKEPISSSPAINKTGESLQELNVQTNQQARL